MTNFPEILSRRGLLRECQHLLLDCKDIQEKRESLKLSKGQFNKKNPLVKAGTNQNNDWDSLSTWKKVLEIGNLEDRRGFPKSWGIVVTAAVIKEHCGRTKVTEGMTMGVCI